MKLLMEPMVVAALLMKSLPDAPADSADSAKPSPAAPVEARDAAIP